MQPVTVVLTARLTVQPASTLCIYTVYFSLQVVMQPVTVARTARLTVQPASTLCIYTVYFSL